MSEQHAPRMGLGMRLRQSSPPEPPLTLATRQGTTAEMQTLIDARADVNGRSDDRRLPTPLFHAVEMGSVEKVELLLAADATLDHTNDDDDTAVDLALAKGYDDIVKLLLDAKALPRETLQRMLDACIEGRTDEVKTLLAVGYEIYVWWPGDRLAPLTLAAKHGHTDIAEILIAAGAEVNELDCDNMTPLMHSAARGDVKLAKSLIDAGADASVGTWRSNVRSYTRRDEDEPKTALTYAAENGHADVIKVLIDAKAPLEEGKPTPLRIAAKGGFEEAVRVLLDANAALGDAAYDRPPDDPAINYAIKGGHEHIVKILLAAKEGARPFHFWDWEFESEDPLNVAMQHNKLSIMKLLIDAKADLEPEYLTYSYSWSAAESRVATAIKIGNNDALRILIEAGARVRIRGTSYASDLILFALRTSEGSRNDDAFKLLVDANASWEVDRWGKHALRSAARANRPAVVQTLLDLKAPVYFGGRSLLTAAFYNSVDVGKLLIDSKADLDYQLSNPRYGSERHETALMMAAENNSLEFFQMLVENKANVDIMDSRRQTALHYAICKNASHPAAHAIVKILVDARASLENRNSDGKTPLLEAVAVGQLEITRLLLDAKANIDVKFPNGLTPLMYAAANDCMDMVKTLLGANPASLDADDKLLGKDSMGKTALMYVVSSASESNPHHIVKMMLEQVLVQFAVESASESAAEDNGEPTAKRFKTTE